MLLQQLVRLVQQHDMTETPNLSLQLHVRLLLRYERLLQHLERLLQHHARLLLVHPKTATPTPTPKLFVRLLRYLLTATHSPTPSCLCGCCCIL